MKKGLATTLADLSALLERLGTGAAGQGEKR